MKTIFIATSKEYTDETVSSTNTVSNDIDMSDLSDIRTRSEITVMEADATLRVIVTCDSGTYISDNTFSDVGKHETGFGRDNMDDDTSVSVSAEVTGKMTFSTDIIYTEKGEDIEEWQ